MGKEEQIDALKEAMGSTFLSLLEEVPSVFIHISQPPSSSLHCFSPVCHLFVVSKDSIDCFRCMFL